MVERYRRFEE